MKGDYSMTLTKLELLRIIDNILDVAESERDEDTKVDMIYEYLVGDLDINVK
jgi:hypothetical protein